MCVVLLVVAAVLFEHSSSNNNAWAAGNLFGRAGLYPIWSYPTPNPGVGHKPTCCCIQTWFWILLPYNFPVAHVIIIIIIVIIIIIMLIMIIINVAIPSDRNTSLKTTEKLSKYKDLKIEVQRK